MFSILFYNEATAGILPNFNCLLFDFILMNIIFIVSYVDLKSSNIKLLPWILVIFYCLFAFQNSDYFTYLDMFGSFTLDFRDPFYYFVQEASFGSYIVFRLLIWGNALLLVFCTAKRFHIRKNVFIFVFSILFLLTFSYARASLAMAFYFFGLSFLLVPLKNRIVTYFTAIVLFMLSYFAHRSLLPIVLLTPLAFIPFNKKNVLILLALIPIGALVVGRVMKGLLNGSTDFFIMPENFVEAGSKYATLENKNYSRSNIAYRIFSLSRFYIVYFFVVWKIYFSKTRKKVDVSIKRTLVVTTFVIVIATSFFATSAQGATFHLGYRYLYVSGISLALVLSYCYCKKICSKIEFLTVLFVPFVNYEFLLLGLMYSRW